MDQTHNCDENAYCVNREPDFECYCFDGYEGWDLKNTSANKYNTSA